MIYILKCILRKNKKKFSLQKIDTNFSILESPKIELNQYNTEQDIKTFKNIFRRKIRTFIKTLQENNNNINLNAFFNNLKTLVIEKGKFEDRIIYFIYKRNGLYSAKENKIMVLDNNNFISLYHELLHCATTKKQNNNIFCGFSQKTDSHKIGVGLTEGYTALIDRRYFNKYYPYDKISYKTEQIVASIVEEIIGKDKMEQLYFNADLYNLVEELKKYDDENNIKIFLKCLDSIFYKLNHEKQTKNLKERANFITTFLLNCYIKKLDELVKHGIITQNEKERKFFNVLDSLSECVKIKGKLFSLLNIEIANTMITKYYSNQQKKASL